MIVGTREREGWHHNCCMPARKTLKDKNETNENMTDMNRTSDEQKGKVKYCAWAISRILITIIYN